MGEQADGARKRKPFIDQVFEDQGRPPTPEEAAELGLPTPDPDASDQAEVAEAVEPQPEPESDAGPEPEPVAEPHAGLDPAAVSLVDEAMKKSALIWVTTPAVPTGRAFWHAWVDGTAYLLTGPGEQPDPDWPENARVSVLVRSKDNAHRLVTWDAVVTRLDPADEDWDDATTALVSGRLNLRDAETAPQRWAAGPTLIYRLTPAGTLGERPGAYSDASHRAAPLPTSATTVRRKPWVLHKRGHSGRPLS